MTTSRILLAIALLAAIAACKIGGDETRTGAGAACVDVGVACAQHSDCCSYGCLSGFCTENPAEGGACRTTDDCAFPRLCKSGGCTTPWAGMCGLPAGGRDTGDVCSSWSQCCSGNCEGGACTDNRAPVANAGPDVADAPYTRPFTLQNTTSDPDLDPLAYGWSFELRPVGSAATLSNAAAANPTFTPDKEGLYVVRLVVTEGPTGAPNRYIVEDSVSIIAVNRPPEPTAAPQATPWSRNVPIRITGVASDPDGDTIDCAWRVTEPGASAPTVLADFAPCANSPTPIFRDYTPAGEGTYLVELVVRDHDRTTNAIVHTIAAGATFVSSNDPPVPAVSRTPYYGNLGKTPAETPAVTLDASSSTDPNGDHLPPLALSFFWEMVSFPGAVPPPILGFDTATPSFIPAQAADYVLRVTATDAAQFGRPGASASMLVTVSVGRYVQPLGHAVADSARAATADKIVLVGRDPGDTTGTKGMIWIYDMATGTEGAGIPLQDAGGVSGIPTMVDVTPDGQKAVIVDAGVSIWVVNNLLATPAITRLTRPYEIADVVVAGNRYAYLFGRSGTYSTSREVDLLSATVATPAGWPGYGHFGTAYSSGTTTYVYRGDDVFDNVYRFAVNNSGAASSWSMSAGTPTCGSSYPPTYATRLWATQSAAFSNDAYVVTECGGVYRADTLASLGTSLGVYPSHVDSTSAGAILVSDGSALSRFNAALQSAGAADVLPRWSRDGYGDTLYAPKAFFDAAGAKRFAIVHENTTSRYGVVTYP